AGSSIEINNLTRAADELWASRGTSLVVSGSNDPNVQILVNGINDLLGNNGNTVDYTTPAYFRKGNDGQMNQFVTDLQAGRIGGVIFYNCNPVYDFARGKEIAEGISKAKFSLATNITKDETAALVQYLAPDHHYLEAWNDFNPRAGEYSLAQPTISPLFQTRQAQNSFLKWTGNPTDYYDFLQDNWRTEFFDRQTEVADFQGFWDQNLYTGIYTAATGAASDTTDSLNTSPSPVLEAGTGVTAVNGL